MSDGELAGSNLVTVAALLHLIRLLGAELVAGEHRDDVEFLIKAIQAKLKSTRLPKDTSRSDIEEGLLNASQLLAPVFEDLRDKAMRAQWHDRLVSVPTSQIN